MLLEHYQKILYRLLLVTLISLSLISNSNAADVTLAWDANTEEDLAGYKLYWGTSSGSYQNSVDVGNVLQYTITGLAEDTRYYFAATAYDTEDNESGYSEEINHIIEGEPPDPEPLPVPACCADLFIAYVDTPEVIAITMEAENAVLSESIQTGTDANGVVYVFSATTDRGYIVFNFDLTTSGSYLIEASINSHNSDGDDSFYVGFVPEAEIRTNHNVWDTIRVPDFAWDEVSLRGPTGTFERADYDPMIWQLTAGPQRLLFAARENNTWLDKIRVKKVN